MIINHFGEMATQHKKREQNIECVRVCVYEFAAAHREEKMRISLSLHCYRTHLSRLGAHAHTKGPPFCA